MPLRKVPIEPTIPLLEAILAPWQASLGPRWRGYRNHCYRVAHIGFFQEDLGPEPRQKLIIACGFHQLGLYQGDSLDHLPLSCELADRYLQEQGLTEWRDEIAAILQRHQKISRIKAKAGAGSREMEWELGEIFRLAYIADLSMGLMKSYIPGPFLATVNDAFPGEGYHRHLAAEHLRWLRAHPTDPFPLLSW